MSIPLCGARGWPFMIYTAEGSCPRTLYRLTKRALPKQFRKIACERECDRALLLFSADHTLLIQIHFLAWERETLHGKVSFYHRHKDL